MIDMNIDFLIETTNIHQPGHLHSSRLAPAWHQRSPAPQRHWRDRSMTPQLPEANYATNVCHGPTHYAAYAWTLSHLEQYQVTFLVTRCTSKWNGNTSPSAHCTNDKGHTDPSPGRTEVPDTLYFVELVHVLQSRDQSHTAKLCETSTHSLWRVRKWRWESVLYRFGLETSLGSWLLNQLSSFPIKNMSRAACFKSIRNPWGVQDMDMDSSSLCLEVVDFLPRNSNKSPGFIIFLQLRHAKRLEFLHIWPARTISTNAGLLVIITLFWGVWWRYHGLYNQQYWLGCECLWKCDQPSKFSVPYFLTNPNVFFSNLEYPKIFCWIGSAPYK